ncbi:MAG: hypothetical protein ABI357_02840 [Granulicella sp.]
MLGSSILDVAIGMAFIYLLLSLIASTVQEAIATLVQTRSANLEHGIRSLFSGGQLQNGQLFIDKLYRHGLVRGLYQDPATDLPRVEGPLSRGAECYAFLQKRVRRLRDRLRAVLRFFLGVTASPGIQGVKDHFLLPSYIPARTFSLTLIDILNLDKQNGKPPLHNIEQHLLALMGNTNGARLNGGHKAAEAMLALLADANNAKDSMDKFRCNLENWYNDAMDRVSGWYKNYTQKVLLVIGLFLAITFNVDSIRVGRTLWFDRDARQGLVNAASSYAQKNIPENSPNGTALPNDGLTDRMKTTVRAFNDVSSEYLLPIGWHYSVADYKSIVRDYQRWDMIHIFEQLFGWLVTAFALSLGAPFWFDLLNKFMVVRGTVKPSEKSRTETSKD